MVDPVVELQSGFARGVVVKHEDGFDYYAFKGVPYAEMPIGELRFLDPVPKKKWEGVIDCKKYGPMCLQADLVTNTTSYSEDCLRLNVFTRSINDRNVNNPVILVIHGGAFVFGNSDDFFYGPDYMIRKNIVFMTFNYRIGVLGFLDLEDKVAPGNQGLKDQVMVLQWIQQNIRVFGGDPDNVTVFGAGAGGGCAHYLSLSPMAKGLFHKIVAQSCTVFNDWLEISTPRLHAIQLCSLLGEELSDSEEILKFLKSVDTKRLQEAQEQLRVSLDSVPFGAGVDSHSSNPFLPVHRDIVASQGVHLPCLVGYTEREDDIFFPGLTRKEYFEICDKDFGKALKNNTINLLDRYNLTTEQIKRLYYKNKKVSEEHLDEFVNISTDVYAIEGIHKFVRVQAQMSSASTYMYQFSYVTPEAFMKSFLKDAPDGACHFDDLPYTFKMGAFKMIGLEYFKKGTRPYRLMEQVTEMWANFAKYGRPTVEISELIPVHWLPITDGTMLRYLNLDEDITMKSTINIDQKFLEARSIKV